MLSFGGSESQHGVQKLKLSFASVVGTVGKHHSSAFLPCRKVRFDGQASWNIEEVLRSAFLGLASDFFGLWTNLRELSSERPVWQRVNWQNHCFEDFAGLGGCPDFIGAIGVGEMQLLPQVSLEVSRNATARPYNPKPSTRQPSGGAARLPATGRPGICDRVPRLLVGLWCKVTKSPDTEGGP